jgi:hypothetical protein
VPALLAVWIHTSDLLSGLLSKTLHALVEPTEYSLGQSCQDDMIINAACIRWSKNAAEVVQNGLLMKTHSGAGEQASNLVLLHLGAVLTYTKQENMTMDDFS